MQEAETIQYRRHGVSSVRESLPPANIRIAKQNISYLAFEGGGGKGFAFLGAVKALEEIRVSTPPYREGQPLLRYADGRIDPEGPIKGVAGASAGAITAVLLASGWSGTMLDNLMRGRQRYNFNRFFDSANIIGRVPQVGGCIVRESQQAIRNFLVEDALPVILQILLTSLQSMPGLSVVGRLNTPQFRQRIAQQLAEWLTTEQLASLASRTNVNPDSNPITKFGATPILMLNNLVTDLGIFSGCEARDFFSRAIADRAVAIMRQRNPGRTFNASQFRHLTFEQHFDIFQIRLALTGTNLESGKSEIFSVDTTPNFPVADAARISMSLPILFKPMIIRDTRRISNSSGARSGGRLLSDVDLRGVWVDGGYYNNLPIRAFDHLPGDNPKTFGIRLEEEPEQRDTIDSFIDYLGKLLGTLMGTGESHISHSLGTYGQTVSLNTEGLSLADFNPDSQVRNQRINQAHDEVINYFSGHE